MNLAATDSSAKWPAWLETAANKPPQLNLWWWVRQLLCRHQVGNWSARERVTTLRRDKLVSGCMLNRYRSLNGTNKNVPFPNGGLLGNLL